MSSSSVLTSGTRFGQCSGRWGVSEWRWRAFKIVQSFVERLPRSWAYALAVIAARFAWRFSPLARPRLEHNLKVACPELTPQWVQRLFPLDFHNHAKAYPDLM